MSLNVLNCDPACTGCIKGYKKKHDLKQGDTFKISCNGIPKEYVSAGMLESVSDEDAKSMLSMLDPVTWAAQVLDWHCFDPDGSIWKRKTDEGSLGEVTPYIEEIYGGLIKQGKSAFNRPYQAELLRCSAKRKVMRLGRQLGKTESIAIAILHAVFTHKDFRVVVITPYQTQIEVIFNRLNKLIQSSDATTNSIKRFVKAPNFTIELHNGSTVKGFTAGTKSGGNADAVRGQKANMLVFDEADYLSSEDMASALAVITNYPDATVWMSSTPSGKREKFFEACKSPLYREFYHPSWINPLWNKDLEDFYRGEFTSIQYQHEIEAEFGEQEAGVYQSSYIEDAMIDYRYEDMKRLDDWIYVVGVDWNDQKVGTTICVTGYSPVTNTFKVFQRHVVSRDGWTQMAACEKIVEINRYWRPKAIYIDKGFGGCVDQNTIISTIDGAKYIKDIQIEDMVLGSDGVWHKVQDKVLSEPKMTYKVKIAKCPTIITSGDHPFFVLESNRRFKDGAVDETKLKWKPAKTLDPDKDLIAIAKSRPNNIPVKTIIDLHELFPQYCYDDRYIWSNHSNTPSIPSKMKEYAEIAECSFATLSRLKIALKKNTFLTKLQEKAKSKLDQKYGSNWIESEKIKFDRYIDITNKDFQLVLGWFISEGNINVCSVEISQKDRIRVFREMLDSARRVFPSVKHYVRKNGLERVFIDGQIAARIFEYFGGKHCANKYIYPDILKIECSSLLKGIYYGDGHFGELKNGGYSSTQISLTSMRVISQLRQWFIDHDVLPSYYLVQKRKAHHQNQFRIDLAGAPEQIDAINKITGFNIAGDRARVPRRKYICAQNYILVPVVSAEQKQISNTLMDLSVEGSSSFTGNGVLLHNTQFEVLRKYGFDSLADKDKGRGHPDSKLHQITKQYDFGSKITIKDLFSKQDVDKPAKPFLVENSVRRFEQRIIQFSKYDTQMEAELRGYVIDHITISGSPVYKQGNEKVGDHNLDALNLSLVGFTMQMSEFGRVHYETDIAFAPPLGYNKAPAQEGSILSGKKPPKHESSKPSMNRTDGIQQPISRDAPASAHTNAGTGRRLWSWPGFEKDAPRPNQRIPNGLAPGRRPSPPSRKKF